MFLHQDQSSFANNKVILFVETLIIDKVRLRESVHVKLKARTETSDQDSF